MYDIFLFSSSSSPSSTETPRSDLKRHSISCIVHYFSPGSIQGSGQQSNTLFTDQGAVRDADMLPLNVYKVKNLKLLIDCWTLGR